MKLEKLEIKRMCVECFNKDHKHELHTGEYVLSFAIMDRTEKIHLCQKHTKELFFIIKDEVDDVWL